MRNLKKVLSLVLCMAMMLSVMVVGAGASYNTFKDQDKIENQEAVFLLNALDIVEGRDTGNFDPAANINRAEAAKLVAALNLAGVPVPNAKGVSSFSDVLGDGSVAWANNYIEYCVSQGSVNGMGDGTFAPKANVTGVQFAKMLLGILGYDAVKEGYVGTNWQYNVNIDAVKAKLYVGLEKLDMTAPLSRDDAAQMMYNALKAFPVIYLTDTTGALKLTDEDLLSTIYPTIRIDKTAVITDIEYNVDKAEYTYTFDADLSFEDDINPDNKLTCEEDYTDLLYMNVMVVYDVVEGVQGMYAFGNGAIDTGLCGDLEEDVADLVKDGVIKEGTTKYYHYDVACNNPTGTADEIHTTVLTEQRGLYYCDYEEYTAIDNDNDGTYDAIIVYMVDIAEVTYVNAEKVTAVAEGKTTTYKYADNTIAAGLAKDDTVAVYGDTSLKTVKVIEKIAEQSGTVNSATADNGVITKFVIGGKTYYVCNEWDYSCTPNLWQNPMHNWPGKTVNFYVFNGYLVNIAEDVSLSRDYLLITSIASDTNRNGTSVNAKAVLGDGTAADITIASLDDQKGLAMIEAIEDYLEQNEGAHPYNQIGYLARYEVVDGEYELTSTYALDQMVNAQPQQADLGFDGTAAVYEGTIFFDNADTNEENGYFYADGKVIRIAEDAQVFLVETDGIAYSVVSGADIINMTGTAQVNYVGYEKGADGFYYATLIYIQTALEYMSGTQYGIITSEPVYETVYNEDGETLEYIVFDLFDGEKTSTVYVDASNHDLGERGLCKGDLISFRVNDGMLYDVHVIDLETMAGNDGSRAFVAAITGYSPDTQYADLKLSITGSEEDEMPYYLADDAKIFIMDMEDLTPAKGGLAISNSDSDGNYDTNAFVMLNDANEVALIVFDAEAEDIGLFF